MTKKLGFLASFILMFAGVSFASPSPSLLLASSISQKYSPEVMRKREEAERLIAENREKLKQNPDDIQAHKAIGNSYLFLEEYEAV